MANTKEKVVKNMVWRFAERIGAQGISLIVSILLARILTPKDYGTIALITVFVAILQVFVDSGLGNALIQKKDADDLDYSTVFYFNMGMCIVVYLLLFFAAPYIASFYNDLSLTPVIRVIGLTLIVSGVKNIQQAYVSSHMLFKRFFYATLGGTLFSGILGVFMAYKGYGVWALVAQQLSNATIDTLILWITVKWRPKKMYSWERWKTLFSFGWKLLVSALIDTTYVNLRNLVIGKKYTKSDLAYFDNGQKIPKMVVSNVNASIGSVLFPALSQEQHRPDLVKAHTRRAIKMSSYVLWPALLGVAACAEPLISIVLTDKWLPAVPYLRIACFTFGLWPIHTTNLQAINAMGRSDYFLKLEIIKKVIGITALFIAMPHGVMAIAISGIITGIISTIVNSWPNKSLLNYTYFEQIKDIMPSLLLSSAMAYVVHLWILLDLKSWQLLLLQIPTGIIVYIAGSKLFKFEDYDYLINSIKSWKAKRAAAKAV